MAIEVRSARDRDEFARAFYAIGQYFAGPPPEDMVDRWLQYFELERMHAAFEDGNVIAGAGAFTFDMSVPGGSLPCAGVTVVGTYPTHRRRGALRAMMDAQLADVHERGEPIAALWASEETIYGRFGYGLAAVGGRGEDPARRRPRSRSRSRRAAGRVSSRPRRRRRCSRRCGRSSRAQRPGVHSRAAPRGGSSGRCGCRPSRRPTRRASSSSRSTAASRRYAIYRLFFEVAEGAFSGRTEVVEAVGTTPQATAEIWRFLLDIDWSATTKASLLPPDHPLFLLLANPRRMAYRMGDSLWVRLVDVGAALSGRAYARRGLDRASRCGTRSARGTRAAGRLEGGKAERTEAAAEIALDVDALGSAYLGAVSFAELRDALRIEELVPGAIARADAVFGWRPLPWCPEIF